MEMGLLFLWCAQVPAVLNFLTSLLRQAQPLTALDWLAVAISLRSAVSLCCRPETGYGSGGSLSGFEVGNLEICRAMAC
jgi:hypothetical protein